METATFDEFTALNEQLAALVEAGVPLNVGLGRNKLQLSQEVQRINATVARRMHRGESLAEALEDDEPEVPAEYRSVVQFGLHTGNIAAGLDGSSRIVGSDSHVRFALESSLVYPLIVCGLAYLGLICFSLFLVPTLEEMYESLEVAPGSGLRALQLLRDTLSVWVAIPPLLLVVFILWWRRSKDQCAAAVAQGGLFRWLPGMKRIRFEERCARFAASLAALIDNRVPLGEALRTAGDASGDSDVSQGAKSLSSALRDGHLPADDSAIRSRFPPFLRWAIWHSDDSTGRAQALKIAARVYHESALRRAERLQTIVPILALVLLGGTVTLLYGLALFVPVVQFIKTLAG